jgi:hyperosmotically inducible periplasmic protein
MRRRVMITLVIPLIVLGSSLQSRARADSPATQGSDAEITDRVVQALAESDGETAGRIHVSTVNGVVTLEGSGLSNAQVLKALQRAHQVSGVTEVRNRLKVRL